MKRYRPSTFTDLKALREELGAIVENGFAVGNEEMTRGLICVAAPIYGVDGNVSEVISCTVSSYDAMPDFPDEIREQVIASAASATQA